MNAISLNFKMNPLLELKWQKSGLYNNNILARTISVFCYGGPYEYAIYKLNSRRNFFVKGHFL